MNYGYMKRVIFRIITLTKEVNYCMIPFTPQIHTWLLDILEKANLIFSQSKHICDGCPHPGTKGGINYKMEPFLGGGYKRVYID
jgi:hypothetical protein